MSPLYRYHLNEDGSFECLKIREYEIIHSIVGLKPPRYKFYHKNITQYVNSTKIDIVSNNSYYTFVKNDDIAQQKFDEYILNKINKATAELNKYQELYNRMKGD